MSERYWQDKDAARLMESVMSVEGDEAGKVRNVERERELLRDTVQLGKWLAHWTEDADHNHPLQYMNELDNWLIAPGTVLITNPVDLWLTRRKLMSPKARATARAAQNLPVFPTAVQPAIPAGSRFQVMGDAGQPPPPAAPAPTPGADHGAPDAAEQGEQEEEEVEEEEEEELELDGETDVLDATQTARDDSGDEYM